MLSGDYLCNEMFSPALINRWIFVSLQHDKTTPKTVSCSLFGGISLLQAQGDLTNSNFSVKKCSSGSHCLHWRVCFFVPDCGQRAFNSPSWLGDTEGSWACCILVLLAVASQLVNKVFSCMLSSVKVAVYADIIPPPSGQTRVINFTELTFWGYFL